MNTIAALIGINPAAAEELTTRLAEVFRYALRASDHEHARLGDELAFVRSYLEIERTRFSERLRIEEQVEPGLEAAMIPSLLLQPLVENAVRHGISTRPEGGRLRLAVRRVGATVVIEIEDDGPGMKGDEVPSGTGFGLHSVRERLRAAGLADALVIESQPGRGTRVRITSPQGRRRSGAALTERSRLMKLAIPLVIATLSVAGAAAAAPAKTIAPADPARLVATQRALDRAKFDETPAALLQARGRSSRCRRPSPSRAPSTTGWRSPTGGSRRG